MMSYFMSEVHSERVTFPAKRGLENINYYFLVELISYSWFGIKKFFFCTFTEIEII